MRVVVLVLSMFAQLAMSENFADEIQHETLLAPYSAERPKVDGVGNEALWSIAQWRPLDHSIIGPAPSSDDFQGRYKIVWSDEQLHLLVEIVDDVLIDTHPDPLELYWDDDCLEIFIDADASGGEHTFSHNAFAYHIALDGNVVDFSPESQPPGPALFNDHLDSAWTRDAERTNTLVWEVSVTLYPDTFKHHYDADESPAEALDLSVNKALGFMLAYCDNDGSREREHFMGSHPIKPVNGDRNRGYRDASVFAPLRLIVGPEK
jgi:hypothetical protein